MMKLYTFHSKNSTELGGIETLLRSLHACSKEVGLSPIELYSVNPKKSDRYFSSQADKESKVGLFSREIMVLTALINAISLLFYFLPNGNREKTILVIFDPRALLFFPRFYLNKLKVVFVQTSKFEVILGRASVYTLNRLRNNISAYVVYTNTDSTRFIQLMPKIPSSKVFAIPCGCKLVSKKNVKVANKNLVTITRISPEKNLEEMIRVMKLLGNDFHLSIYGSGDREYLSYIQSQLATVKNVDFRGPTVNVEQVLREKAIFLMTSFYEGYGQTLIEARSQGLPIVAYDTFAALSTIVQDGQNGYIVSAFETELFAKRIVESVSEDNYYRLSRHALSRSVETEPETIELKWKKLFLEILK